MTLITEYPELEGTTKIMESSEWPIEGLSPGASSTIQALSELLGAEPRPQPCRQLLCPRGPRVPARPRTAVPRSGTCSCSPRSVQGHQHSPGGQGRPRAAQLPAAPRLNTEIRVTGDSEAVASYDKSPRMKYQAEGCSPFPVATLRNEKSGHF